MTAQSWMSWLALDTWSNAVRISALAGALPVLALRSCMEPATFSWWTARGQTLAAAFMLHAALEMVYEAVHTDVGDAVLGGVAGLFLLLSLSVMEHLLHLVYKGATGAIIMYVVSVYVSVHCAVEGMMLGVSGQTRVLVAICVHNVPECAAMMASMCSRIDVSRKKKGQRKDERLWVRMLLLFAVVCSHQPQITVAAISQRDQLKDIPGWVFGGAAGYILGMCAWDLIPEALAGARLHNVSTIRWAGHLLMYMAAIEALGWLLVGPNQQSFF